MRVLLTVTFLWLLYLVNAQDTSPQFKYESGKVGFQQGIIDQEVLTALIQKKQQEVKKDVFFNLVVDNFKKLDKGHSSLHNFATYNFIYNIFDEISAGKSKKAMTQALLRKSLDYSYVYAFAWYSFKMSNKDEYFSMLEQSDVTYKDLIAEEKNKRNLKADLDSAKSALDNKIFALSNARPQKLGADNTIKENELYDQAWSDYLDVAFTLLVIEQLNPKYSFSEGPDNVDFMRWYHADNNYQWAYDQWHEHKKDSFEFVRMSALKDTMKNLYSGFVEKADTISKYLSVFDSIEYNSLIDASISENELMVVKYILSEFIKRSELKYENNVVSTVLKMIIENLHYEKATSTNAAYVYIDVEALIARTYSEFEKIAEKKGFFRYVMPVVDIGVNYSVFGKNTSLNGVFSQGKLNPLYYVSEKIGIRWKLWNWKYTHGIKTGQNYTYYNVTRYWLTPPKRPIVSDIHFTTYFSGFLYQIRELKTERQFNYFIWGNSLGVTFFNSLVFHAGFGIPMNNGGFKKENIFGSVGFDLPLSEYIAALAQKVGSKQ